MSERYERRPGVTEREVGEAAFLVDPTTDSLYHLNATAAALWRLLAEPIDAGEAAEVLKAAFPDAPPDRVETEVAGLFADLAGRGLIRRCG